MEKNREYTKESKVYKSSHEDEKYIKVCIQLFYRSRIILSKIRKQTSTETKNQKTERAGAETDTDTDQRVEAKGENTVGKSLAIQAAVIAGEEATRRNPDREATQLLSLLQTKILYNRRLLRVYPR